MSPSVNLALSVASYSFTRSNVTSPSSHNCFAHKFAFIPSIEPRFPRLFSLRKRPRSLFSFRHNASCSPFLDNERIIGGGFLLHRFFPPPFDWNHGPQGFVPCYSSSRASGEDLSMRTHPGMRQEATGVAPVSGRFFLS